MPDVISAFLDNEPFDSEELSDALSTENGRRMLVDLIALRSVVQPALATVVDAPIASARFHWQWVAAAVVMLIAGFALGHQVARSADPSPGVSAVVAPAPTAGFKFEPGVNWRETPANGGD
jgi:hypothetical protein